MLTLQIAAGIVLAAVVLRFWRQALWLIAGSVALILVLLVGLYFWQWPVENWLAVGGVLLSLAVGAFFYGPLKRLEERRKTVKDGPPPN